MDAKVPELLDLTRKLLDQAMDIVKTPLSYASAERKEILYRTGISQKHSEATTYQRSLNTQF